MGMKPNPKMATGP